MPKQIVICCDGTGQKLDVHCSNVVRLFSVLDRSHSNAQIACYDAGVGTIPSAGALTWVSRQLTLRAGQWFGYGLLDNVARVYGFLVDHYEQGDPIYLFGFSRGAFTVRVLAGLLHRIGVLRPEAKAMIPYAFELYRPHYTLLNDRKRAESESVTREFRRIFARPGPVQIEFLGLWDTVKAFGILWPRSLPHTRHNPDVKTVRHALALDERRRSYVPTSWGGLDDFIEQPASPKQNVREVWFIGSHSDVGGGYRTEKSGLSWISLRWMIAEARKCELRLDDKRVDHLLGPWGEPIDLGADRWKLHKSRSAWWWIVDQVPRVEITNSPPGSPEQLSPGLSVPLKWPKRRLRFWPTTGRRQIKHFKRDKQVLLHKSVGELIESGKYKLNLKGLNVDYDDEDARLRGTLDTQPTSPTA
jgi:uncharacterized protein (DUF2235 family)